jgi:hypothetical protein
MKRLTISFLVIFMAVGINAKSAPDTLIFTHEAHMNKYKIGKCEACHVNILKSTKARDDNYADQQLCNKTGCHDIKNQDSCYVCHTSPNGKTPIKPKREIKFNHKVHIKKNIDCKVCHGYIEKMAYFERTDMPLMSVCMECHEKEQAGVSCELCHTDPWIVMSHGMDDRQGHGELYNRAPHACETCHLNNFCDKCHQAKIPDDVHPRNYLYVHQFDAIGTQDHCYACHDPQQFCDGCHKRTWGTIVDHQTAIRGTRSCSACHTGKR